MLYARILINNSEEEIEKIIDNLKLEKKSNFSFYDLVYINKNGKSITDDTLKIRVYNLNEWDSKDVLVIRKKAILTNGAKEDKVLLKEEFDTLEELKASIKEKLEEENTSKAKYETEEEAIKTVCDDVKVEIPSGMVETETDNMIKEIEQRLMYQGLNLAQYLQMMNKTESDMRKELEEQAKEVKLKYLTAIVSTILKECNIFSWKFHTGKRYETICRKWKKVKVKECFSAKEINLETLKSELANNFLQTIEEAEKKGIFDEAY